MDVASQDKQSLTMRIQSFSFVLLIFCGLVFCMFFAGTNIKHRQAKQSFFLTNEINPNYAPVESLIRLPRLGISRARAIVEYREVFSESGRVAFKKPADLQNVKGIGPAISKDISRWLTFDDFLYGSERQAK